MTTIKSFEDFLDRMQGLLDNAKKQGHIIVRVEDLENAFPELAESDDERIRKGLLKMFNHYVRNNIELNEYDLDRDMVLAWLEKQGEKNTAKPMFAKGDWIVHNVANFVFQIVGVGTYGYNVVNREGYAKTISLSNEENYHLWNIKDAKDGDVLVDSYNNIGIFKNCVGICWHSYVYLGCHGEILGFNIEGSHEQTDTYPATKEQRDTLFAKMKEEGYEWNANKKELKKIEQIPAWSEEDEMFVHGLIRGLAAKRDIHGHTTFSSDCIDITEAINWLKSLKERCTWKPSDEQIVALEHFVRSIGESGYVSPYDNNTKLLYTLLYGLKKLKG